MTAPDRSSRFDEVDLTTLSIVALEAYLADLRLRVLQTADPFFERAYQLRIAEVLRRQAVINRRETERQDALTSDPTTRLRMALMGALAEVCCHNSEYQHVTPIAQIEEWRAVIAEAVLVGEAKLEASADAIISAERIADLQAAQAASAERVRALVREAAVAFLDERKLYIVRPEQPSMNDIVLEAYGHGRACDAVALQGDDLQVALANLADRIVAQLTAPPPGHVCPVPYGLGPEDLDLLEWLSKSSALGGMHKIRAVLDKIRAEHRAGTEAS